MALVHLQANHAAFTDGVRELEVDGATVGAVIDALAERFAGLGPILREASSVAIDGELQPQGTIYARVGPTTEIHFLAPIAGG
ncbi:MAG: MoaD/ThiS family protein [Acidimicrobiales bacterium]